MCGRVATAYEWKDIEDEFNPEKILAIFKPRYNLAPTQDVPVIVAGSTAFDLYKWGLLPIWAKTPDKGMINARADSIAEKPWFKHAFINFAA